MTDDARAVLAEAKATDASLPLCAPKGPSTYYNEPAKKEDYSDGDDNQQEEEDESTESSTWEVLLTLYVPILLLWLRRSMFGTANLIRSIVLGQFLHLLMKHVSPQEDGNTKAPAFLAWLQPFTANHHAQSWPPALIALAVLTIFAFVVHPDGITWFILGKIRDGVLALIQSVTTCCHILINDYGILPTLVATLTLAGLGFVVLIVVRTLTPKTKKHQQQQREKKKKKRKGHHPRGRGGGGRIRQPAHTTPRKKAIPVKEPQQLMTTKESTTDNLAAPPREEASLSDTEPETVALRPRVSTLDSAVAYTDDQSCDGSASVRSFASAPTAVTISSDVSTKSSNVTFSSGTAMKAKSPQFVASVAGKKKQQQSWRSKKLTVENGDGTTNPEKSWRTNGTKSGGNNNNKSRATKYSQMEQATGRYGSNSKWSDAGRRRNGRKGRNANTNRKLGPEASAATPPNQTDSFFSSFYTPYSPTASPSRQYQSKYNQGSTTRFGAIGSQQPESLANSSSKIQSRAQAAQQQQSPTQATRYKSSPTVLGQPRDGGRNSNNKSELAAFLARVGITGLAAEEIMTKVHNVDGLGRLSLQEFALLGIGREKVAQIRSMLQVRTTRPVVAVSPWRGDGASSALRPPPGLAPIGTTGPATTTTNNNSDHQPFLPSSPRRPTSIAPLTPPSSKSPLSPNLTSSQFGCTPTSLASPHVATNEYLSMDNESQIEAELQELGGQMAGSILDF